jgi:hypothetical protein
MCRSASLKTLSIIKISITVLTFTLKIPTLGITPFSIMGLTVTLSILKDTQYNNTEHNSIIVTLSIKNA